jgi:hypothetical protein
LKPPADTASAFKHNWLTRLNGFPGISGAFQRSARGWLRSLREQILDKESKILPPSAQRSQERMENAKCQISAFSACSAVSVRLVGLRRSFTGQLQTLNEKKRQLAVVAKALLPDYAAGGELTVFTVLDGEDFYAQG